MDGQFEYVAGETEPSSPCKYRTQNTFVAPQDKKLNPNEKVIVTQEGLDDWRAQLYGLDLSRFPKHKPPNVPDGIFDELRKKYDKRHLGKQAKSPCGNPNAPSYGSVGQVKTRV